MVRFAEAFPNHEIVQTLSGQSGWSHFAEIIPFCEQKSAGRVELLELEASGIRVAEYLTELPPQPLLVEILHDAITIARRRFAEERPATNESISSK